MTILCTLTQAIEALHYARLEMHQATTEDVYQAAAMDEEYWLLVVDTLSNGDRPFIGASW